MSIRVLIVEDDKHIRKILHSLLTHDEALVAHQVEVAQAQDGREALDQVEKGAFDLIISDLLMPRMDGFQFGRELRKHANGEKTALIITSAIYKNQAALAQLQRDVGPHQFFAKPFQLPEIVEAVRRGLKLGERAAPAPVAKADVPPADATVVNRIPPPSTAEPTVANRIPPPTLKPKAAEPPADATVVNRIPPPTLKPRAPEPPPADATVANRLPPPAAKAAPKPTPAPPKAAPQEPLPTSGKLEERAPPRLFLELAERRMTGQLALQRGKVKKSIVWVHGSPVAVESNLRTETLGHFLVLRGVLDEAKHQEALAQASSARERMGATLVRLGFLTETELLKQLGAQARSKLAGMVRWADGEWTFAAGEPPTNQVQTPMDCPRVVFAALQQTANAEQLAQQLAQLDAHVVLSPRAAKFRETFLKVFGPDGWEAMNQRPLVSHLIAGANPAPMLAQLDALLVCGLAELEAQAPSENIAEPELAAEPEELFDELFGGDEPIPAAVTATSAAGPLPRPPAAPAAPPKPPAPPPPKAAEKPAPPTPPTAKPAAPPPVVAAPPRPPAPPPPPPKPPAPPPQVTARSPEKAAEKAPPEKAPAEKAPEKATLARIGVTAKPDPAVEALRKEVLTEYLAIPMRDFYERLGVARDATGEALTAAYAEKLSRFALERFAGVDLGRDYAHLEELHQAYDQAFDTLHDDDQRATYDAELAKRPVTARSAIDVELSASKASQLLANGEVGEARELLEEVVAAMPEEAGYHALLGWATFLSAQLDGVDVGGAAARAWLHLEQALAIDTDNIDAHELAGRVAAAAGDDARAITHLERALDGDPLRDQALIALEEVFTRTQDWKRLERQYRKLIHKMSAAPGHPFVTPLWWKLAQLYRERTDDRESARVALGIYSKLAPDDPRWPPLMGSAAGDSGAPQSQTDHARKRWLDGNDGAAGAQLFALQLQHEAWDRAYVSAAVLHQRAQSTTESDAFLRQHAPRFLPRVQVPIDDSTLAVVRHADEQPMVSQLYARLFRVHRPASLPRAVGDLTSGTVLLPDDQPEPFGRVLRYLVGLFGGELPSVVRVKEWRTPVEVVATMKPALFVRPDVLALTDRRDLGFVLARALVGLAPERLLVAQLPGKTLKTILLAGMSLVQGDALRVDDGDGSIAALRTQLAADHPALKTDLAATVDALVKSGAALSVSRHTRALTRTADRVALLVCGDVERSLNLAEADTRAELSAWALSDAHLELRETLGLSIAV